MDELSIRRYIRELNKTYCSLDPINVSKITVAFEAAAPFIASLVNKYFEERISVTSEKVALLWPTLGPILFTLYTSSLATLLEAHNVAYHFYADGHDTQIYIRIDSIEDVKEKLSSLITILKFG